MTLIEMLQLLIVADGKSTVVQVDAVVLKLTPRLIPSNKINNKSGCFSIYRGFSRV